MNDHNNEVTAGTLGMDLGDRYSHVCLLDEKGSVLHRGRIRTTPAGLKKWFEVKAPMTVALEAGTHSGWVSRALKEMKHEVIVANPRKLRLIYENQSKNDDVDAETLARIARLDRKLLGPIELRGEEAQADLAVLRSRDELVRSRTGLINHVRGTVKAFGSRIPKCSSESFDRRADQEIPSKLRPALEPVIEMIQKLTEQIRKHDRQIEAMGSKYPETQRLRQVPGVGPLTSVGYVLTIEDPGRFKNSRAVGSYLGLRPRQRNSGERKPQLRITKAGDKYLRQLLVSCAHYILGPFGPPTDLRRWGQKLAKRGGKNAKKRAVVAVARKLAVLLHRLWVSGESYEPQRQEQIEQLITV